jgi:hypothetical protein
VYRGLSVVPIIVAGSSHVLRNHPSGSPMWSHVQWRRRIQSFTGFQMLKLKLVKVDRSGVGTG